MSIATLLACGELQDQATLRAELQRVSLESYCFWKFPLNAITEFLIQLGINPQMQLIIHDGKFSREGFAAAWQTSVGRDLTGSEKAAVGFLDVYVQTHQAAIVTAATSSVAPKVSSTEESLTIEHRNNFLALEGMCKLLCGTIPIHVQVSLSKVIFRRVTDTFSIPSSF